MILPESRNLEWIEKAAKDNNASNPILVEKVIRAFFYWLKTFELMK